MKITSILFSLFFLLSLSIHSQEKDYDEQMVVVKGCKKLTDNLELKNCFSKVAANTLRQENFINALAKTLNPGQNKLQIIIKVNTEKEVELVSINTINPKTKKLIQKQLKKLKILQPGTQKGSPVNVIFTLPLTLNMNTSGPLAIHKMSRLVFLYDESNTSKLRPVFDQCIRGDKKEDSAECMNTYLVDGTFNSVETKKISPMLQDGLNKINVKIVHNEKNEITDVIPASGNSKLDEIFKEKIEDLLQNVEFVSPSNKETSYSGELMLVLNYLKQE